MVNPTICLRQLSSAHWSGGDVFVSTSVAAAIGLQPNTLGGAVKGSKAAGGAVSVWFSEDSSYVNVLQTSRVNGESWVVNYDGGECHNNQTWLGESFKKGGLVRCLGSASSWNGHAKPLLYLGDALVTEGADKNHWTLTIVVTSKWHLELLELWECTQQSMRK
jgi:hypothetical protein